MTKKKVKYIMGRLNLIAAYESKFDYLYKSLRSNVVVDSLQKVYKFGIFNINHIKLNDEDFLSGTLTKFAPIENAEKVNIEKGIIDIDKDTNNVIAKSNFTLHVKSGLIAFRPSGNQISIKAFQRHIAEIIQKANEDIFSEVDVQIISEENDIFYSLKNFDIIHNVDISLHPSNPSNRDIWEKIDKELREANIENYSSSYSSNKGIKVKENEKIYSEISMAADGYGKAKIKGMVKNKQKVASTDELPVKFEVIEDLEDDKPKNQINSSILEKFMEVWKRMKS